MSIDRPSLLQRAYAACYDLGARFSERRLGYLREMIAGEAEGRVLEIGSGTGANFEHYRWARVEGLEATEPDAGMRRRARAKAASLPPYARERLQVSDAAAEALPFPDASFDAVVSTLVFCTVRDLTMAIGEARRVLKPGGTLRVLEHVAAEGFEGRVQHAVQPVYGLLTGGCHLTRNTEQALSEGGFEVDVLRRERLGPLFPAFAGLARKPVG